MAILREVTSNLKHKHVEVFIKWKKNYPGIAPFPLGQEIIAEQLKRGKTSVCALKLDVNIKGALAWSFTNYIDHT